MPVGINLHVISTSYELENFKEVREVSFTFVIGNKINELNAEYISQKADSHTVQNVSKHLIT